MLGCAIDVIRSVDGMKPILMDFMLLGSVILVLLTCQMNMTIGSYQGILIMLQLELEPTREAEQTL